MPWAIPCGAPAPDAPRRVLRAGCSRAGCSRAGCSRATAGRGEVGCAAGRAGWADVGGLGGTVSLKSLGALGDPVRRAGRRGWLAARRDVARGGDRGRCRWCGSGSGTRRRGGRARRVAHALAHAVRRAGLGERAAGLARRRLSERSHAVRTPRSTTRRRAACGRSRSGGPGAEATGRAAAERGRNRGEAAAEHAAEEAAERREGAADATLADHDVSAGRLAPLPPSLEEAELRARLTARSRALAPATVVCAAPVSRATPSTRRRPHRRRG